MNRKTLGVAVIGCGRMGRLRASMAAAHPAVSFLAVADVDPGRARAVADTVGAELHTTDNLVAISDPRVNTVIVSTSEAHHADPVVQALRLRKPVLVEKPMAMTLQDADAMLAAAAESGTELRVGYSRRFKRSYLLAKEQVAKGKLGKVVGATLRAYNSRAQSLEILRRSPDASPVAFAMTYYVDLICWFLEGRRVVDVVARGQKGIFRDAGYNADDVTWAILTFDDGAVVTLGVDYALPASYPTFGANSRVELLGTEGVVLIDDDNKDQIVFSEQGLPHAYVPGHHLNVAFMGSTASGDWAQGNYWGPLADESRTWLDHLAMGRPCSLTTGSEGRNTLQITLAVEEAARSGERVKLT